MRIMSQLRLFPMATVLLLALAIRPMADPAAAPPKEEPVPAAKTAVPPIDAAAPAKFETATFALG